MASIHRTFAGDLIILFPQEEIRKRTVMWQNDGENAGHDIMNRFFKKGLF